jgi:hypothetical protein
MSYEREDMIDALRAFKRYITCGRVTKRPIFDFVSTGIRANDACMVFAHDDDYSYGVLQSGIHWIWFTNRCSTLTERYRQKECQRVLSAVHPVSPADGSVQHRLRILQRVTTRQI